MEKNKNLFKKLDSFKMAFFETEEKTKNRNREERIFKNCNFIKLQHFSHPMLRMNQFRSVLMKTTKTYCFCQKRNMQKGTFLKCKREILRRILTKNAECLAKNSLYLFRNICYINVTGKKKRMMITRQYLKKGQFLFQNHFW